jgi:hypothetical protein
MAEDIAESDDTPKRFTVSMRGIEVTGGRTVAVGRAEGSAETFVRFVNNAGTVTAFRLTEEAACALRRLLNEKVGDDGTRYVMMTMSVRALADTAKEDQSPA